MVVILLLLLVLFRGALTHGVEVVIPLLLILDNSSLVHFVLLAHSRSQINEGKGQ